MEENLKGEEGKEEGGKEEGMDGGKKRGQREGRRDGRRERKREGKLAMLYSVQLQMVTFNSKLTSLTMSARSMKPKESFSVFTNP